MHEALAALGYFKMEDFKSRVLPSEHIYVADGHANNAFVHVELRILSGRDVHVRNEAGEKVMVILREAFADSLHERSCILSVEVREMERETYRKVTGAHISSSGM
jgi:5-carboxymethyl-2-hydroxymuconate isomerase